MVGTAMAPDRDEGSVEFRLGKISGKIEGIEVNQATAMAQINNVISKFQLDFHRHNDEIKTQISEQRREFELTLDKHVLALEKKIEESRSENKQLFKYFYIILGGALVAWYFLQPYLAKLAKP